MEIFLTELRQAMIFRGPANGQRVFEGNKHVLHNLRATVSNWIACNPGFTTILPIVTYSSPMA